MKKKLFIFIGIILTIFVIVVGYLVVSDLKEENILKKEIINVSNKDLLTDNYDISVKTTGDYGYIEEAIKKFYKKLSDSVKELSNCLNNEELTSILSANNLKNDRPKFQKSYQIINDAKASTTNSLQVIIDLCSEEAIKNLIDKEKVDNYYYDLYLELMYTEDDLKELEEIKNDMNSLSNNLNLFLDKVLQMLQMLENNSNSWYIENEQLYFQTDALVDQYNTLYNELNTIVKEKFSNNKNNI